MISSRPTHFVADGIISFFLGGGGVVAKLCLALETSVSTVACRLLCPGGFPGKSTEVRCHLSPGIEPMALALQVHSLPRSHEGSLSLFYG